MNKLITKIAGAALGLSMAVGVGVGYAVGSSKEALPVYAATSTYNRVASLTAGDEVLIVAYKETSYYYLSTSNGSSSAPSASTLTVSGSSIVGDYDTHLFTVEADGTNWKFKSGTNYLYTITNNNGIRIGTNSNNSFIVTSKDTTNNYFQMKNTATNRYVGIYQTSDWRCYTSATQSNYGSPSSANQIQFYKKAGDAQFYTVSFDANGGSGTMSDVSDATGSYTLPDSAFTAPENKTFVGWKANNTGEVIAAGESYTVSANVTFYAQWADAYTVTYTAGTNGSGSFAHAMQPAGSYTLLDFADLTGVSANSGYRFANYTVNGVDKNPGDAITLSASTSVAVNFEVKPLDTTYNFATNFSTYASDWTTTYGEKTLQGSTSVGGDYAATIVLGRASKQSSGTIPTLAAAKNTTVDNMIVFTLAETGYKIKAVTVTFVKRSTNTPTLNLFKGRDTTASGVTALDSATIGTKSTLSVANLNDTSFSVNCIASGTSNNCSVDLSSIYISLEAQAAYGTTDHIKVTGMPRTVYHIGEVYDSTGLAVTAYDGADESTANFKDVTSSIKTEFTSGVYAFVDTDVPSTDMWIKYEEDGSTYTTAEDITIYVYALAEYQLVETAPADWSGNYLIVATDGDSNLVAMNGSLANPNVEGGYQTVTEKSAGIIEAGQESEWTIASYSTGYSVQGKSGKYIGRGTDKNGMDVSDSALLNTLAFTDGEVIIYGSAGNRLSFSIDGNRFRYYSSGTVKLYKLVESSKATNYADMFLEKLSTGATAVCKVTQEGIVQTNLADLKQAWKVLADDYNLLSANDKEQFRTGVASDNPSATNIAKALALYDYVAAKYNTQLQGEGFVSNYDFMSRDIVPLSSSKVILGGVIGENSSVLAIIVIVSLVSITAIGGYFFVRKSKEQE